MARGRRWFKEQKKNLKRKLKELPKSEQVELVKSHLDNIYDLYSKLIALIPDIEARMKELEDGSNEDLRRHWSKVLNDIKNLEKRPKAMKIYYAKNVVKDIKKLRRKYPDE